jgi:perosamine synthetase
VPATTFPATINIVLQCSLKPVFTDVHPDYYDIALTFENADKYLTDKTVAIIPVNLFGQTCDLSIIATITQADGYKLILDSCETIGVEHNSQPMADFADIICFSFYNAHIVQGGVGGIGITRSEKLSELMRSLVNHGRRSTYISIDDKPVELTDRFTFDYPGYSYRITEFESALALSNFHNINKNLQRRAEIAAYYKRHMLDIDFLKLPAKRLSSGHSWMMFPLVIKDPAVDKLRLCKYLEKNGIETRDMLPLINQPVARNYYNMVSSFPVSENLVKNGFYISCSDHLTIEDMEYVIDIFKAY